jgi:hypothetical protein
MTKKLALLSMALGVAALALAAPVSIDRGSLISKAAFARGGDDGGCLPDDHGICRGEPEPGDISGEP